MRALKFGAMATTLTLILLLQPASSAARENGPSASGHGNLTVNGELRTFSFSAVTHQDGEVMGQAQVKDRSSGRSIHMEIDCLEIIDNGAVVSGTVIKTKDADQFLGYTGVFVVHDNGEGNGNGADKMSLVYLFPPGAVNCPALPLPDGFIPPEESVEAGNIQVKP